jgi:hypothetical protein
LPQPVTSVTDFAMTHYKKCIGRADVGIGPYGSVTRGARKESPNHGFAVPAPFRQGGLSLRIATGAARPRNDREFCMGYGGYCSGAG